MISSDDDHVNLARNSSIGLEAKPHQCLGWFFSKLPVTTSEIAVKDGILFYFDALKLTSIILKKGRMFFICNLKKNEGVMKFPIQFRRTLLATLIEPWADSR